MIITELKNLKVKRGCASKKAKLIEEYRFAQSAVNHAAIYAIDLGGGVSLENLKTLEDKRKILGNIEQQIRQLCYS